MGSDRRASRGFRILKDFLAQLENTDQARTFGSGSKRFERKSDGVSNIVYCESLLGSANRKSCYSIWPALDIFHRILESRTSS